MGLNIENNDFYLAIILGALGTILFFFSLAGASLSLLQRYKGVYLKNLNVFVVKQIGYKVNTNFLSMALICLMLLLTMGTLSTGLSFKHTLESALKKNTPFDVTVTMYMNDERPVTSVEQSLNRLGFSIEPEEEYASYGEYRSELTIGELLGQNGVLLDKQGFNRQKVIMIKESEFNAIRALDGKKPIEIGNNEVLVTSNNSKVYPAIQQFLNQNDALVIREQKYFIGNKAVITDPLKTSIVPDNLLTLIVPDHTVKGLEIDASYLNVNFTEEDSAQSENRFLQLFEQFRQQELDYDAYGFIIGLTKNQVYNEIKGLTTIVLFIGIYLGIVFLIASMAILALQQLLEASDSLGRYQALRKIGATEGMINRSIFQQTLIYFSLPMGLAFIHALVGIDVVNEFISIYGKTDIGMSAFFTAVIFLVIYMGYFYATYTGYRQIVHSELSR